MYTDLTSITQYFITFVCLLQELNCGTLGHSDTYVSNGRKWSNSDSDQSGSGKYKPLRNSTNYPTLKAMEWDHALKMDGFGESSTDYTLRPKKKGSPETVETPLNTPEDCRMSHDGIDNPTFEQEKILMSNEKLDAIRSADLYKKRMMDDRNSTDGALTDKYSLDSQSFGTIDDAVIQKWKDELNDDLVTKENSHLFETRVPIAADSQSVSDSCDSLKKCAVFCNESISQSEDSCIVDVEKPDSSDIIETMDKGACSPSSSDGERTGNSSTPIIEPPENFKDSDTNLDMVGTCKPPTEVDIAPSKEIIIVSAMPAVASGGDGSPCDVEDVTCTSPSVHDLKERYESLLRPSKDNKVRAKRSPRRNTFTGEHLGVAPLGKARSIEDITNPASELERVLKKARRNTYSGELDDENPNVMSDSNKGISNQAFEPDDSILRSIEKLNGINRADMFRTQTINDQNPPEVVQSNTNTSCDGAPPRANNEADGTITLPSGNSPWNTYHGPDGQRPLARVKPQVAGT